jgi:assimilatory nitrate reductase catalytic subunit
MSGNHNLLRRWQGPMTRELLQKPAAFGLGKVPERLVPNATTWMVCGFCSTGCSLDAHLVDGHAVNLTPTAVHSVNLGMACPKGWEALTPLEAADRATVPLLRDERGVLRPVSWRKAMERFCGEFRRIQETHGPDSVAWLGSGQITTEELAFLGALGKFGMGIRHGDGNTRQCMASSVVAYKQAFGFDAPPFTYADFEQSDVIVLVGSNLAIAHPILWQRVLRNRNNPQIVVLDPRTTETASAATLHLPLGPKSDLVLLYSLAHILIARDWVDHGFISKSTSGYDAFRKFVAPFTPDFAAGQSGLKVEVIEQLAEMIHNGKAVSFWWTMGVNQGHEAVRTAQAIINLALMTGNIGRPGTGANSITGQCNAMGSRLFSNTTSLFGGRDFESADDRRAVADILNLSVDRIPDTNSLAYDEIVAGIREGRIKGLWLVGTNPSHSWIHQGEFNELIRNLEFFVVQDMYHSTETAQRADLMLPAAGWGEKEGTFINSERRFGVIKKVRRPPGEAMSDFDIFRLVAHFWGCGELFADWTTPERVFQIVKQLSAGRPCDITGIRDYQALDDCGGIQWPWCGNGGDAGNPPTERRLFEDGRFFTEDQRARFLVETPRPPGEVPDSQFPWILLTGRGTSAQWHTQSRTSKSQILQKLYPAGLYLELNPEDAARVGVGTGDRVRITSRRGSIHASVFITSTVRPGQVFLPMHYPQVNRLTYAEFDPYSRQPSYKSCAVRIDVAN